MPQSLGNTRMVLIPGVVCDQCNNYFARKVEKPFMDAPRIRHLRHSQSLTNKRGRVPTLLGTGARGEDVEVHAPTERAPGQVWFESPGALLEFMGRPGRMLLSKEERHWPSRAETSRFMAKVAVEFLAWNLSDVPGGLDYLVSEPRLDPLRDHARRGGTRPWEVSVRQLYLPDSLWAEDGNDDTVQRVWEADFIEDPVGHQYVALALFGTEYVIDIGDESIAAYRRWLIANGGGSPLFTGKNAIDLRNRRGVAERGGGTALLGYRT